MNRPRPVVTATGIAGLVTSIAGVLTFLGYSNAATSLNGESQTIGAVGVGVVLLGSHLLAGLHAQSRVTPVVSPQDHDGTPLVRVDTAATGSAGGPVAAQLIDDVPSAPVPSQATVSGGGGGASDVRVTGTPPASP